MKGSDRRREWQVGALLERARKWCEQGRSDEALPLYREAVEISRGLAADFPDEASHRRAVASALYTVGALATEVGEPDAAIEALAESELLYRALGEEGLLDAAPLVADVVLRRGLALAGKGHGASAVAEADTAVAAYAVLATTGSGPHADPAAGSDAGSDADFARVLAGNARILDRFGDPDVAVASADQAIRLWLTRRVSASRISLGADELSYLLWATEVASAVHARHGRSDVSLFATELGMQFLAALAPASPVPGLLGQVRGTRTRYESLAGAERTRLARDLAESFRTLLSGRSLAPEGLGAGVTLAEALAAAGAASLASRVTRPALDCAIAIPSQRGDPGLAAEAAYELATAALAVLPARPADGARIGLEAHWLFAAASRLRLPAMRHEFHRYGRAWAQLLLALSGAYGATGSTTDTAMAADLAAWAAGTAEQLAPHALLDPALADLATRCVRRHEELRTPRHVR